MTGLLISENLQSKAGLGESRKVKKNGYPKLWIFQLFEVYFTKLLLGLTKQQTQYITDLLKGGILI